MKKYIESERPNLLEPNVYISMIVEIEGSVSKEAVAEAVNVAYGANEATMSRIVWEQSGEAYYEKRERTGCKIFFDNRQWKELICESEKMPFALKEGELVRTYITETTQGFVLLVHAHHLVGDGNSVLILIEDIVNSLGGKQLCYKPMVLLDKTCLQQRARLPLGFKRILARTNRKWQKTNHSFTWQDYEVIHQSYWKKFTSDIEVETYSASKLKTGCGGGVTLNSYLIAKLLKEHPESRVVGIPISVREGNRGMSNQTSGIAVPYQYQINRTFEENLSRIHKMIYQKLGNKNLKYFVLLLISELSPTLIDSVLLQTHGCYENPLSRKMAEIMGYMGNRGRDLGITNLTRIEMPNEFETFQIKDIIFIPPKVSYTKEVVGICTYGNRLHISYHKMRS